MRFHVDLELADKRVQRLGFTISAEDAGQAIALAKKNARALGHHGRVLDAVAERLVDDPADPEENRVEAAEDAGQIKLSTAQRLELAAMAKSLPVRSATRLALELALQTDGLHRDHNWGPFGDAKYCRHHGCNAVNGPLANRQPCKGGL